MLIVWQGGSLVSGFKIYAGILGIAERDECLFK